MYNYFAKYYDKIMGNRQNYINFIDYIIKNNNITPKNILDLACWTWKILSLLDVKYNKYWIDYSENMIEIARKNVKKGTFFKQDIKNIQINNLKFDLITCFFDSINHLLDFSDWEKVFNSSYNLLNKNWIFLFDINTKYKLDKISNYKPIMYEIDNDIIFFTTEYIWNEVVRWNIKIFNNFESNNYKLYNESIEEKSYDLSKIKKSLNFFSKVIILDHNYNEAFEESERVFFICIK